MTPDRSAADPRPALAADVSARAAIINGWIDATPWFPRVHTPAAIEGFVRDAFGLREMWVIGDPVAGCLSLDPKTDKVHALYCARTGEGLGRALMNAAKRCRDFLTLNTHEPNVAAQRFYHREGFVTVRRVAPTPPETVVEITMERRA
jgi:putative acetyltransferase